MGDVVNLKRHRKRKARAEKDQQADENRIRFGRTKAERKASGTIRQFEEKRLDAHKRDKDEP